MGKIASRSGACGLVLLSGLFIAACGGGGGGDSGGTGNGGGTGSGGSSGSPGNGGGTGGAGSGGGQTSPATIAVSASTSAAFEGGSGITLTSSGAQGATVSWTVSPPVGTLSATTGPTVTYTPPKLNELAADVTVTVTAAALGAEAGKAALNIYRSAFTVPDAGVTGQSNAGSAATISLVATPTVPSTTTLYAQVADPKSVLLPTAAVSRNPDGTYAIALQVRNTIAAGTYQATATVTMCLDANCATPLGGGPLSVPYSVTVAGNTGLTTITAWSGVADWSTYQGNPAHTAYVPVTIDPLRIGKRWTWTSPLTNGYPTPIGHPVESGGRLFVNVGNTLQAIDENDASAVWSYDVGTFSWVNNNGAQDPAVDGGHVWFSGGHQSTTYLFSLDATSGALRTQSQMSSQWEAYFAPVVVGGNVYSEGGTYGGLFGFDGQGNQLFFANAAQTDQWSPAADANYVYIYTGGSGAGAFQKLDRFTGAVLTTIQNPAFQFGGYRMSNAPVLTTTGGALVYDQGIDLTRFDITAGAVSWQVTGNYAGNPAYANGVVYAINRSPYRVEARDERTGALQWSWTPTGATDQNFTGDVLVTQNLLFVSTNANAYAIDLASHATVWSYPQPGTLSMSATGLLYLATYGVPSAASDGSIVAFNLH